MREHDSVIRSPVVAGAFYPSSKEELKETVETFLTNAVDVTIDSERLYGIISPHAGYVYSGIVAAAGYKLLKKFPVENVVVIAPSHQEYFEGSSVFAGSAYQTPLGIIPVNKEICNAIANERDSIRLSIYGHRSEHSLEVQLPFLQLIFPEGFKLIPIVMGINRLSDIEELSQALNEVAENYEITLVASSDLSHYHPYDVAVSKDQHLISLLESYDMNQLEEGFLSERLEACGISPILALMKYALLSGNPIFKKLDYKNSGDTSGMKSQVVGYVSAAVYEK
jgi:hypothetical protein